MKNTSIPLLLLLMTACNTPQERPADGSCLVTPEPGWVNSSTYRLRSFGQPSQDAGSLVKRRTQSEENALLCAQGAAAELMTGSAKHIVIQPAQARNIKLPEKIAVYIKGGQIVKKTCDHTDACEIIFEISGERLKEKSSG